MNTKFIDLLEKCGCSEKGKCDCKEKGKTCNCKAKHTSKGKEIKEGRKDSEEWGDARLNQKKEEWGKKCPACGKEEYYINGEKKCCTKLKPKNESKSCENCGSKDGFTNRKCNACGDMYYMNRAEKDKKKTVKESKFERYLIKREELNERANIILEKLGSLDAMGAADLGVPANTVITIDMLVKAYKKLEKSGLTIDQFMKKVKSGFVGASSFELDTLKSKIEMPDGTYDGFSR